MATDRIRIFVSSVQRELAAERRGVVELIRNDPLLQRFFDVFAFEHLPASDRRVDDVYLTEVCAAKIYVGLFGDEYGNQDSGGLSPTEHEFDEATAHGKARFVFVKGVDDGSRHPRMQALVAKAGAQLIRRRFSETSELTSALYASLVDYLETRGIVQNRPFDQRPTVNATMDDIDAAAVATFVRRARYERRFPLPEGTPTADVLAHLNLLHEALPTNAAVLLFGRELQRFIPCAEVRCMHFHGTDIERPAPSYQIFKGNLFEQVDQAENFVLSVVNRRVGTRSESARASVSLDIPPAAVREAIVNAVAHRDYASTAAVQVSVFADRVEVWTPGELPPPLTPERLRGPHSSIARNARLCEALFLARYIEKYGTGTLMMIRECSEKGLPDPDFVQRGGEFVVTVWRDWLTAEVLERMGLNHQQRRTVAYLKENVSITNTGYQAELGVSKRTASRDLDEMVARGVVEKVGSTGKGVRYVLAKGATKGPKGPKSPRA